MERFRLPALGASEEGAACLGSLIVVSVIVIHVISAFLSQAPFVVGQASFLRVCSAIYLELTIGESVAFVRWASLLDAIAECRAFLLLPFSFSPLVTGAVLDVYTPKSFLKCAQPFKPKPIP